ncbi:type I pullulanase [Pseudoscardovia suis]|uniref:Pullulanase n=1 Tax=Pseudoscardovia suis TaxID=987063 RepID=A0A261F4N9_9BIFI|nr:type I pullulanase [Pseudoscardovia suis]OZG54013.1 pullulanase [Pseudoscardovia suis]PJJ65748.1 pullulanase [Pseudoscardovia suis]
MAVNPVAMAQGITAEYHGDDLGAVLRGDSTVFSLWAPTAAAVTVRLYRKGSDEEVMREQQQKARRNSLVPDAFATDATTATVAQIDPATVGDAAALESRAFAPFATYELTKDRNFAHTGVWRVQVPENLNGVYYDYALQFDDGTVTVSADPWAKAAGVNGKRSMVIDLASTEPDGWENDRTPQVPANKLVVWETHVVDFSADPRSGVPRDHCGTFLGFTHPDTTLDGAGVTPTCVNYLKNLGVTCVQIEPMYDYGSVDEAAPRAERGYNWGYDPVNYNVPEGSYSTNPFDGAVRIRECKQMVQALHEAGIKVIMDVVYNHMYTTDNWFERTVPGYFCRRDSNGAFTNGSGCGCDMASEKPMMRKFIADSVAYWAKEYHIDGFRFDLMGLIDVDTMTQVRQQLEALGDGKDYILYGEPWFAKDTPANHTELPLSTNANLDHLDEHVGAFCDASRDTIKGHVHEKLQPGYVNGAAEKFAPFMIDASDGWRHSTRLPKHRASQMVQYVSSHDDLTLWDKLCITMRAGKPAAADYDAQTGAVDDIIAANRIAAAAVLTSAGLPFFLSGEEFGRTKHGNSNSYNGPFEDNVIFWERAERMSWLVDTYRTLIAQRGEDPAFADGVRFAVPTDDPRVVAFQVGSHLVAFNPTDRPCGVRAGRHSAASYVVPAHDYLVAQARAGLVDEADEGFSVAAGDDSGNNLGANSSSANDSSANDPSANNLNSIKVTIA